MVINSLSYLEIRKSDGSILINVSNCEPRKRYSFIHKRSDEYLWFCLYNEQGNRGMIGIRRSGHIHSLFDYRSEVGKNIPFSFDNKVYDRVGKVYKVGSAKRQNTE